MFIANLFSKKGYTLMHHTIISTIIFAILYFIQDYIITYFPESRKFLIENYNDKNTNILELKPFYYYLWFSLVTQSTVGYNFIVDKYGKSIDFLNIKSKAFKVLNLLQLSSIIIIPSLLI